MASNSTTRHDPAELGELEREHSFDCVAAGCGHGRAGARGTGPSAEGLDRAHGAAAAGRKGLPGALGGERGRFVYRPAESRQRVAGRAVKRIVDWFCEGSVEALLVGMVDSKMLDRAELQRLAERIAEAQKNYRRSGGGLNTGAGKRRNHDFSLM